ncbi:MAG: efflux RND transporter periplasmic adaptor subunit [Gammaproteobacteria bacterium]|nr:efflux RND transporter periplasmic adaptor subunit [Gammaproteobacteria bacterium]
MRARTYLRGLLFILILAALAAGLWYASRPQAVSVTLYTVALGSVEATVANTRVGTIKACRRSMLAPTMGGEVASLNVTEGDRVKTGQILLEIWNRDLKAQLRLAEAQKVAASMRAQESCKVAAGSERELTRMRKLEDAKLVAQERLDVMETDFEAKQLACDAAQASVAVSSVQIDVAASTLERTIVRAPFDGVVAEVNAELGEYVTPSPLGIQTLPTVDLVDLSCLYVSAPIDEVDAPPIVTGMQACVSLDAFPERRCNGRVRRIAPYVLDREKQARTVEVEVVLSEPQDTAGLLPGYSADIEIILDRRDNVLRIPTEAVLEGNQVFLYDPLTGILQSRTFEPGLANWNFTEVRSGLVAGDQIVVSIGREGVAAGARVIPEDTAGQ